MILYFVLAVAGAFALLLLIKLLWSNKQIPLSSKTVLAALAVLLGVLGLGIVSGRLHPLAAMGTAILPFLRRILTILPLITLLRRFGNPLGGAFQTNPFQQFGDASNDDAGSEASTSELTMTLDHGSGNIDGSVLCGKYANRDLSTLGDSEIADLYHSLKEEESKRLLEAYIQRHRPNLGSEEQSGDSQEQSHQEDMTVQRAADILGVEVTADRKQIIKAHRRLIQHLHPDQGGSSYLAAEINEARRVLLEQQ